MLSWFKNFLGVSSRKRKPFADLDQQWDSRSRFDSRDLTLSQHTPLDDQGEGESSLSDEELHARFLSLDSVEDLLAFLDDDLPDNHPLQGEVFAKLLSLPADWESLKKIFELTPAESEWERHAVDRCLEAATLADCQDFLDSYDLRDEIKEKVSLRILAILQEGLQKASTVDDCIALYDEYGEVDPEFEGLTDEMVEKALSLSSSLEECDRIIETFYDGGNPDGELEEKVHTKRISFLQDVSDCSCVWDDFGVDSVLGEVAICRAAEIITSRRQGITSEGENS